MENARRNRRSQVSIKRPYCILSRYILILGPLRSDSDDVHKNVGENRLRLLSLFFSRLFQGAQLLKRRELGWS